MVDKSKRKLALGLAAALFGLAGCASNGKQEGGSYFQDAGITARVKTAIFNEPGLKIMNVSVETSDRVVELSGSVKSRAEKLKVGDVARRIDGVKRVKNDLTVQ
jgi:osmotically-inducible protein OsmY